MNFMIKKGTILIALIFVLLLSGCSLLGPKVNENIDPKEWKLLLDSSAGSTLVLYHDLKSEAAEKWLTEEFKPALKEKYNINLEIKKKAYTEYFDKLVEDQTADNRVGSFDMILIDNPYFQELKSKKLIYGPFLNKINAYYDFQNFEDKDIVNVTSVKNDNYAALIGRDQLIMMYDENLMDLPPATIDAFLTYLTSNNKKFAYTDPAVSQIGRDFINTIFVTYVGYDKIMKVQSVGEMKALAGGAIGYLNALEKVMPVKVSQLPKSQGELDALFFKGDIQFGMTESLNHTSTGTRDETLPEGAKAFVFDGGTTGKGYYALIPFNSGNKSGAMLAIDAMLSVEMQKSKYNAKNWGNLFAIDVSKLDEETAKDVRKNVLKRNDLKEEELMAHRIPDVSGRVSDLIYQVWVQEVKNK